MTDPNRPVDGEDNRYTSLHGRGTDVTARSVRRRRQELFNAQHGLCHWCGEKMQMNALRRSPQGNLSNNTRFASFEHVIPRSMGGTNTKENVVLAHASCNNKRHRRKFPHDPIYGKQEVDHAKLQDERLQDRSGATCGVQLQDSRGET